MSAEPIPFYGQCEVCARPLSGKNLLILGLNDPACRHCYLSTGDVGVDHTKRNPEVVNAEQIEDAFVAMDRELSEYAHLPFTAVDRLVGAIPPGDVGFVAAFSGGGKTTFVSSGIQAWLDAGKRIYCLPLESVANVFRTHIACKKIGLHAGMILTGEYKRSRPVEWPSIRAQLREEIAAQNKGVMKDQLYVSPTRRMDVETLERAAKHAHEWGADLFVIDHIDHIAGGEGKQLHAESSKVVDRTLDVTLKYGLVTVATTQVNHEGIKGADKLAKYRIPEPHHIYMGGKKRHISAWQIGLGRPLKFHGLDKDELAKARAGDVEAWRVLEPECMSVGLLKSRHFGEREGARTYLSVINGKCQDMDPATLGSIEHGIPTVRRPL